jgi:hypothetical protein
MRPHSLSDNTAGGCHAHNYDQVRERRQLTQPAQLLAPFVMVCTIWMKRVDSYAPHPERIAYVIGRRAAAELACTSMAGTVLGGTARYKLTGDGRSHLETGVKT